jgi:hypothetical protein
MNAFLQFRNLLVARARVIDLFSAGSVIMAHCHQDCLLLVLAIG